MPTTSLTPLRASIDHLSINWPCEGLLAPERTWRRQLRELAQRRASVLEEAHRRVREASRQQGLRVRPQGQGDVLGLYVLLPDRR